MIEEEKPKEEDSPAEGVVSLYGKRGPHNTSKSEKRPYNFTDKCLAARRKNALKSTGPKTAEGKAVCAQNSWKNGLHASVSALGLIGKPCLSTCTKYPCTLVTDGATKPGSDCLDKEFFLDSIQQFQIGMMDKKYEGAKEIYALQLAKHLNVLNDLHDRIMSEGSVVKNAKMDKDGRLIGWEHVLHPAILGASKLMAQLNISFDSMLLTPAAVLRAEQGKKEGEEEDASTVMARALELLAERVPHPSK